MLVNEMINITAICACHPENQPYLGLQEKEHDQQAEGDGSGPLVRLHLQGFIQLWGAQR